MTDRIPDAEDFTQWLESPVTRFVLAGMRNLADRQKAAYAELAWVGDLSEVTRERHVTRADCYAGLAGITYDQALGANGVEETEPTA